jgi:uncharacterized protein
MGTLKDRLTADMRTAMKSRDATVTSTLRMVLTAVGVVEVSGAVKRELTDEEVLAVLAREAKKRREAAVAFAEGGRPEQAEQERAEEAVLAGYLPQQLSDAELTDLVTRTVAAGGWSGMGSMGQAMKAVQAAVAGRAEGGKVAAEVRRALAA